MPINNFKSPFATSFKSATKRGIPCGMVVQNIAKRTGKTPQVVFTSLWKAGLCDRQKFNGQWVYWACDGVKGKVTDQKKCQTEMWQCFVDWCVCSGLCTPEQMSKNSGNQQMFMKWCKKFFGKQFTGTVNTTTRTRKTRTSSRSYSMTGNKGTTRKYSRAA